MVTEPVKGAKKEPIYNHPNIKSLRHQDLIDRLEDIRNRRLLAALDFKAAKEAKMARLADKLKEQYDKLEQKILVKLSKVESDINMLDNDINKLISISHKTALMEEGL